MSDQLAMFDTPKQIASREYNERLAAYMDARKVPGGYQCPDCGGVDPSEFLHWLNHGHMGARCMRAYLRRNHALYALRTADLTLWVTSTADLRQIAAWRAGR